MAVACPCKRYIMLYDFMTVVTDWLGSSHLLFCFVAVVINQLFLLCYARFFFTLDDTVCWVIRLHGGLSGDFKTTTMADSFGKTTIKTVGSSKTFFDINVNTRKIGMGFESDTPKNESNMSIFSDFRTKIWLKSYWRATVCSSKTF